MAFMVIVMDAGQGDATLLEYPDGSLVLVDCGSGQGTIGYYWTATAQIPMQFLGPPPPLIKRLDSGVSAGIQIAGRYVRRL